MDAPTTTPPTEKTTAAEHVPTLLTGAINGNGAELALLLEACRQLLVMHHAGVATHIDRPYRQLSQLVQALERGPVPWIDQEEPGRDDLPNPDSEHIRRVTLDQARATVLQVRVFWDSSPNPHLRFLLKQKTQAMAQCVAVQRRLVTGSPYGLGVTPDLADRASRDPKVRWVTYRPVPEEQVEALFYYVRQHDNMHLAKAAETLDTAKHWQGVVLPDIAGHYRDMRAEREEEWGRLVGRTTTVPSRSNTVLTTE